MSPSPPSPACTSARLGCWPPSWPHSGPGGRGGSDTVWPGLPQPWAATPCQIAARRPLGDSLGRPSLWLCQIPKGPPGGFPEPPVGLLAGGHEGGKGNRHNLPLSSPLFDPRRRRGVEWSGRPSSRRHQAAAARNAGHGRRPLAPGPEPRGPARTRRLAGSTGSMARTHPLTGVSTVAPRQDCVFHSWREDYRRKVFSFKILTTLKLPGTPGICSETRLF